MPGDADAESRDLRPLLQLFVEVGELDEGLYKASLSAAASLFDQGMGSNNPADKIDFMSDLAMDFLVNRVRAEKVLEIRTVSGLKKEMLRYLTLQKSPEMRELWEALSGAMRALAGTGHVIRIDADWKMNNSNAAMWSLPNNREKGPLDIDAFRISAAKIGTYYPRRDGGKVISPSDARVLVQALLKSAEAPIAFGVLIDAAKSHVVFQMRHQESVDHDEDEQGPATTHAVEYRYDLVAWLDEEAEVRIHEIWRKSGAEDCGHEVLCTYFLPRHFLGRSVTLQQIGGSNFRAYGRASKAIEGIFASGIALQSLREERDASAGGLHGEALSSLAGAIATKLLEKCAEKYPAESFNVSYPDDEGSEQL